MRAQSPKSGFLVIACVSPSQWFACPQHSDELYRGSLDKECKGTLASLCKDSGTFDDEPQDVLCFCKKRILPYYKKTSLCVFVAKMETNNIL